MIAEVSAFDLPKVFFVEDRRQIVKESGSSGGHKCGSGTLLFLEQEMQFFAATKSIGKMIWSTLAVIKMTSHTNIGEKPGNSNVLVSGIW